jgi:hypothetical protein
VNIVRLVAFSCLAIASADAVAADEPIFSGPQVGEKLPAFKVRGVFDDEAGKELDFVSQAAGKPIVLVFVHDVNRQSISMTRVLTGYTTSRAKDGLTTGVIWLNDDATEAENGLKRMRHALTPKAANGISMDGREGPGSYGLNRNVQLTILVGTEGKVTGNFALVQPSLQVDLPKVLASVVAVAGGTAPKLEELEGMRDMMRRMPTQDAQAPNLRPLLTPVIKRDAAKEDVEKAAKALEEHVANDEAARKELGRIASTIVNAGKVENYGTATCQEYLKKWAKEYGPKPDSKDAPEQKKQP